jgi:6-phosphogluconate dehydrogenase
MPGENAQFDLGLVGLGVMGRNFILNLADHGYRVAGHDKDQAQTAALEREGSGDRVRSFTSLKEFVSVLRKPRAVMMLVPAGQPVDSVIDELLPELEPGDIIIDGGNSHFTDTNKRVTELGKKGVHLLGVGISGGAEGARRGPSIMPGGDSRAYARVQEMFEKASAHVNGEPCVTYLGTGSAGHYVKMVHNGIEYGLMQLIAESYDLLKRGAGLGDNELHETYREWNDGALNSFLVEITAHIFSQSDPKSNERLIDKILDEARQKGTGKWTSQDAMDIQVPVMTIHAAVAQRHMSAFKSERILAEQSLHGPERKIVEHGPAFVRRVHDAIHFAFIVTFAQGMSQLSAASREYSYDLNLADIAKIWRGGCIIRAAVLEDIRNAWTQSGGLANMLLDKGFAEELDRTQAAAREVAALAIAHGIPAAALLSAISYYDSYRSGWLPANLVQAQRDFFGSHSYERVDEKGSFHTQWQKLNK